MENTKHPMKKVLTVIWNVVLWLFVIFAVVVTVLAFAAQSSPDGVPAIGGKCILTVQTPSMEDTLMVGDIIISEKLTPEQARSLAVGDVISFDAGDLNYDGTRDINSHRIIEIKYNDAGEPRYVTKGDNNDYPDSSEVAWQNVICRWNGTRIAGAGKVLSFMQQPKGFLVCIVLPLALFFFYELFVFVKKYMEVKNSGKKQITAADEEAIRQQAVQEYIRQQAEAANAAAAEKEAAAEEPHAQEEAPEKQSSDDAQ